mgnify:CR=1 FL=1
MKRLWITEEQADTLKRALDNQIIRLKKCARQEEDLDIKSKYLDEAGKISDIIDIIEM